MIIHLDSVRWAKAAGFSMRVIRLALRDVHHGISNFPDAIAWHDAGLPA